MNIINVKDLEAEVARCLVAADGDVIRALELSCATTIVLGRSQSAGLNRMRPRLVHVDDVPHLTWRLPDEKEETK